jgi:hypothetical protein
MANFGEMSVALLVARHGLENEMFRARQIAGRIGLGAGSVIIVAEGFERDIGIVDEAAGLLKVMARYEDDIRDLVKRKEAAALQPAGNWLHKLASATANLML